MTIYLLVYFMHSGIISIYTYLDHVSCNGSNPDFVVLPGYAILFQSLGGFLELSWPNLEVILHA